MCFSSLSTVLSTHSQLLLQNWCSLQSFSENLLVMCPISFSPQASYSHPWSHLVLSPDLFRENWIPLVPFSCDPKQRWGCMNAGERELGSNLQAMHRTLQEGDLQRQWTLARGPLKNSGLCLIAEAIPFWADCQASPQSPRVRWASQGGGGVGVSLISSSVLSFSTFLEELWSSLDPSCCEVCPCVRKQVPFWLI